MTTPVPPDPDRFKYLSPDKPVRLRPGATFPSPEEFAQQTLDRIAQMYKRGIDGN